jgi:hypothetical protein
MNDRVQSDTSLALAAGAVCAAGAAHGLLGSPWLAFVMASGSAVAMLSTPKAATKNAARSVLDSLAAVAIYNAVRASCRPVAASTPIQALPPKAPERPWASFARPSAPRLQIAPTTRADLADRVLTPEHQEELDQFRRGNFSPVSARRNARQVLALLAQEATASVDLAHVQVLRTRLDDVRAGLRRVRLLEEATAFASWNNASLSAREHRLRLGAGPMDCSDWTEDAQQIATVEATVGAAERRVTDAAGGDP